MKMPVYTLVIAAIISAGALFTACNSAPVTPEEAAAQAKVDSARMELKEAQKAATAEEWAAFKIESEEKIRINELSIADLKNKRSSSNGKFDAVYAEKIAKLEQQNKNLKAKIVNYEKRKSNWASFKSEFNHDLNELGKALSDLTTDNKK
ncbi:MAG: hypothetical protein HGA37_09400 [Lentimicrobium sp.]|nr:hypothetical protein [Lentimicrobium sp.]